MHGTAASLLVGSRMSVLRRGQRTGDNIRGRRHDRLSCDFISARRDRDRSLSPWAWWATGAVEANEAQGGTTPVLGRRFQTYRLRPPPLPFARRRVHFALRVFPLLEAERPSAAVYRDGRC